MTQALAIITQSRRPHQTFRVGYDMPARQFETGADVLAASRAVYARMHPQTPPVARSMPPAPAKKAPAKFGKPKDHPGVYKAHWRTIVERVAASFRVTVEDLLKSPERRHVAMKRAAIYQIVIETGMTFPQIASALGYRDHSSVIHHYKRHKAELDRPRSPLRDMIEVGAAIPADASVDVKCAAVVRETALRHGITPAQIYGSQRRDDIADARTEVYLRLYRDFGLSFTAIGLQVGHKSHATIIKAIGDLVGPSAGAAVQ